MLFTAQRGCGRAYAQGQCRQLGTDPRAAYSERHAVSMRSLPGTTAALGTRVTTGWAISHHEAGALPWQTLR